MANTTLDITNWQEFKATLRSLGANSYDLVLPETSALVKYLKKDEVLEGILYGRYKRGFGLENIVGRGLLAATNQRVLMLDKKPLFTKNDELIYGVISGVTRVHVAPAETVTLHTRMGDINMRTFNYTCSRKLTEAIHSRLFDNPPLSTNTYTDWKSY